MYDYLDNVPRDGFDLAINSMTLLGQGLRQVARVFTPYLLLTLLVLIIFSLICSLHFSRSSSSIDRRIAGTCQWTWCGRSRCWRCSACSPRAWLYRAPTA